MKECGECDGAGTVECPHCGTSDMEDCRACDGTGEVEDEDDE